MGYHRNLTPQILEMRNRGLTYRQIQKELQCSKGTINYICRKIDMVDIGKKQYPLSKELKLQIFEYCKTHSISDAVKHFKLSTSSINKYKKIQE
jgi:orotate phosphoribosyltransferase-like protein